MLGNGRGDSVKWNDLGATSGTGLDSSHAEGLMLDRGPQAAAIMAIKSPSSDKVSCKSNPQIGLRTYVGCNSVTHK